MGSILDPIFVCGVKRAAYGASNRALDTVPIFGVLPPRGHPVWHLIQGSSGQDLPPRPRCICTAADPSPRVQEVNTS
jgi:hypothetical protein